MGLNPKKIIKKEITTDSTTGNIIVTITLSPKKAGEVRTEADSRDARKIAIEEGYTVGNVVTDCYIENRHASATGTWEFYPSYATNKTKKAPVEKAKPAPKKEATPKKKLPRRKIKKNRLLKKRKNQKRNLLDFLQTGIRKRKVVNNNASHLFF